MVKKKTKKEIKPNRILRNRLMNALNRLDEFASNATADNDNGEAEQQTKDYNLLANFIQKYL